MEQAEKDECEKKIAVMQHYMQGGKIESTPEKGCGIYLPVEEWEVPSWNWSQCDYRIALSDKEKARNTILEHLESMIEQYPNDSPNYKWKCGFRYAIQTIKQLPLE